MDEKKLSIFKTKMKTQKNLIKQSLQVKELDRLIPSMQKDTIYNIVTQKKINPYTFILSAINKEPINCLTIATYTINLKTIEILCSLMDEQQILQFNLLVNKNMKFAMKGNDIAVLAEVDKRDNFKLIKKYNHSKITLIEQDHRNIVITGSGNYSDNPRIEQYTVMDDKGMIDFHKGWILG